MAERYVGAPVVRREDERLVTGRGRYVDDVGPRPALELAFVRSPQPHARILAIDAEAARHVDGVLQVLTGADLASIKAPPGMIIPPGALVPGRAPVPADRVVFEGEVVAVVVALDRYVAADAAELVDVTYEPLPVVGDVEAALDPATPPLYPELGSNVSYRLQRGTDDVEAVLAASDVVVQVQARTRRLAPAPLETPGIVAEYDPLTDGLVLHLGSQRPQASRDSFAACLGVPEHRIRVIARDMGGSFGSRSSPYPEELVAAYVALKERTTVCWSATRYESLRSMSQGRAHSLRASLGVNRDGQLTAIDVNVISDLGALLHSAAAGPAMNLMGLTPGPYRIPTIRCRVAAVFTNKPYVAPYRGAGRPEAALILERAVNEAARAIGMDPAELRRRNFVPPDAFPYTSPAGAVYDSGHYGAALEKALALVDYDFWRAEQQRVRIAGRYIGIGICSFVEPAGSFLWEKAEVRVHADGKVTLLTGSSPHGQGHQTVFAQVVADELGVSMDDVVVLHGDTTLIPKGGGSFGSRSATLGGSAALVSARSVKGKMVGVAANLLEVPADDLVLEDARFHVVGAASRGLGFAEVAQAAHAGRGLEPGMSPGLESDETFTASGQQFPFGSHVAVVEVHLSTGAIQFLRYVGVDDCGNMLNPLLVEGQVLGGLVQGFGEVLFEELAFDEGAHLLSTSLMEYALPKAAQVPRIELDHTTTPSPLNPLGAKGAGEAGAIASPPAVLNAVLDALAPLGIKELDMPLTPPRVWAAIQRARAAAPGGVGR